MANPCRRNDNLLCGGMASLPFCWTPKGLASLVSFDLSLPLLEALLVGFGDRPAGFWLLAFCSSSECFILRGFLTESSQIWQAPTSCLTLLQL